MTSCNFHSDNTHTPSATGNVEIVTPITSEKFNENEIYDAFHVVISSFDFEGCDLLSVRYDEETSKKELKEFDKGNSIIILSSFYVSPKGAHQSFNADFTYEDLAWFLERADENEPWTIKDYGFL